jgi:phosphotransferase system HPr (HPr) family protein
MSANSEDQPADTPAERIVVLGRHLHARPAGQVSQLAAKHQQTVIELLAGDRNASARSVLAVMGLGAVKGDQVKVIVTGSDADAVADEIVEILHSPDNGE